MNKKIDQKIENEISKKFYNVQEEQYGDWKNVAELKEFEIMVTQPATTLLSKSKVDVMFLYEKKPHSKDEDQKRLVIFGEADAVYDRSIQIINRKKNDAKALEFKNKFRLAWRKAMSEGYSSMIYKAYNPFGLGAPSSFLSRAINNTGLDKKTFAEKFGKKSASLYHHTKGRREISREAAIEYAEKLNCDPVDLLFNKLTVPVWAKVNTLKASDLDITYGAGRLFAAYAETPYTTIVPRDIYKSNIKAIQIDTKGSMYENQIAFYYYTNEKNINHTNKLCVVGTEIKGFMDEIETHYYFGLYEENRGKSNLLNPDPYAPENFKYFLKDFEPTFIAPVVAIVNPNYIVDNTLKQNELPNEIVRNEEKLRRQIENLIAERKLNNLKAAKLSAIEREIRHLQTKLTATLKQAEEFQKRQNLYKEHQDKLKVVNE